MNDKQYGLLFDVRRSVRYHDRRRSFFEQLHQITGGLTVLLSGSVLFDIARPGDSPSWLLAVSAIAAVLAAWDMVVGYAAKTSLHRDLKKRFAALEMDIVGGVESDETFAAYSLERLRIEQDEPPIYRALDLLCHNELLRAEGFRDKDKGVEHFSQVNFFQRLTRHFFHWADLAIV
ncbi:MAG: hypothetical protein A2342_02460 [Gallionellales bacterium RIFOXYB12_FULL_54_9]|nr:MAG: hypothetical protein A2342_02460 [Gallionellales bacterium RIFOXYB12_FULL_54_9]